MLAQKYQIRRLKLPKLTKWLLNTDIIAFSGISGSMEEDFFHQKPILKKGSARPEIKIPHMRIGCHSPFKTLIACSQTPYFLFKVLWACVININRGRFIDRQRKGVGVGEEEKDFEFKWLPSAPLSLSLFLCSCAFLLHRRNGGIDFWINRFNSPFSCCFVFQVLHYIQKRSVCWHCFITDISPVKTSN